MLEEKITKEYIEAMKAKDSLKATTLNFLRAQLKNVHINKKIDKLEDAEVITVIKKQVKQRQDSIEQFKLGGRNDLAEKESKELNILKIYLPKEMSADELQIIIDETIKQTGSNSIKDMGAVMKNLMPKIAGKSDNKLVSELVKNKLSSL